MTSPPPSSTITATSPSTGPTPQKAASLPNFGNAQHIKPDFSLFREGKQHIPSLEQQIIILNLFPTSCRLSLRPPFLIIYCTQLPPKPWPVSVAGVPLFLTDNNNESPMNYGFHSHGPKASIKSSIALWKTPDEEVFQEIFNILDGLGVNVHRLRWIGTGFLALAEREPFEDWRSRLPFSINNILISYVFDKQDIEEEAIGKPHNHTAYKQLFNIQEMQIGSPILMDTPVNGLCEGIVTMIDVYRTAKQTSEFPTKYVVGTFAYYGNEGERSA